jgi:hypothetical protein
MDFEKADRNRLLKTAAFQSLVQKHKSITFPKEGFDSITPAAAKQKQISGVEHFGHEAIT